MSKKPSRSRANASPPKSGGGKAGETTATGPASGPMDPRLLEQFVKLMAVNDLNTIDVRDGQRRVILKRGPALAYAAVAAPQAVPLPQVAPPAPGAAPAGGTPAPGTPAPAAANDEAGLVAIKSEMVGTFYSKPSPDAKPFVSVGSPVDEETVVCVIEAMKHFNPVKAEVRGTIARILVSDGEVVDVDKPLFLVKPS